jgi:hypothetical protein
MSLPRLSIEQLHAVMPQFPPEMRTDPGGRVIGIANTVILHFLGREWIIAHIRHDAPKKGFLNLDFSSDRKREASTFRVIEFAENLLNLQHLDGFEACIAQMRGGGQKIESTCAELDFGRFLYIHDVPFRFVEPQMAKGSDFDFEVTYPDGLTAAADAKCKFETTAVEPDSLRNAMKKARSQLPADRPGLVFIKVPQRWIEDTTTADKMIAVAREFLATTGRIASIKFYVSHLRIGNGMVLHRHALKEISNPNNRFDSTRNWDLFSNYYVPPSWNGMPPKWHRIFFWPEFLSA